MALLNRLSSGSPGLYYLEAVISTGFPGLYYLVALLACIISWLSWTVLAAGTAEATEVQSPVLSGLAERKEFH